MGEPSSIDEVLVDAYDNVLKTVRTDMVRRNTVAPSFVVVISPNGGVKYTVSLDPAGLRMDIKISLRAVPDAHGFICVHDGHIVQPTGPREALLAIRGTRAGVYGRAYPYERTPFGARFDDSQIYTPTASEIKRFDGLFPSLDT